MRIRTGLGLTLTGLLLTANCLGQDRPKITSVSHLSVYTSDAAKTEQFYVHELGAFKGADPQNPAGVRYYFNPIQFVEVLPLAPGPATVNRFDHAGYNTADVEAMRKYLGGHGVSVPEAVTQGSDGSKYFEVKDPEGNQIQFLEPPAHPVEVPANPLSSHIIHVGYIIHDVDKESSFYQDVLGFRPYWHGGQTEDSHDWTSIQVPNGTDWVELMKVKGPETTGIPATMTQQNAGVLDHFSLGVPNIEEAVDLLYRGDRLDARHSDPKIGRDSKWQVNFYDPDGIRAEIMEFQPMAKPCCSPFLADSPTK